MNNHSLSHTTWNCKYHIVFAPKYRRKIIFGELKQDIAYILSIYLLQYFHAACIPMQKPFLT